MKGINSAILRKIFSHLDIVESMLASYSPTVPFSKGETHRMKMHISHVKGYLASGANMSEKDVKQAIRAVKTLAELRKELQGIDKWLDLDE